MVPKADDVPVVGQLAASVLNSLAQRDVLALQSIMQTSTASQSGSFAACVLSLWRHCALQSRHNVSEADLNTLDDFTIEEDWGWVKAHDSFRRQNNNQVAKRQRGTRPD